MADAKSGLEVRKQSVDNSFGNTEPVLQAGTITGVVSAILAILLIGNVIDEDQRKVLEQNIGIIIPALVLLAPVIASLIGRLRAYSPRSAAKIAVENASDASGMPTLSISPP
jgi:hypothetical protein